MRGIWISTTNAESWEQIGSEDQQNGSFIDFDNIAELTKETVKKGDGSVVYRVLVDMKTGPSAWWNFTTEGVRDDLYNELYSASR